MNNLLQDKLNIATTLDKQWSPSIYMQLFLSKGYPPGAPFRFYGYNGKEDFNALKGAILKASKSSGTDLTVLTRVRLSKVRAMTAEFSCVKHLKTRSIASKKVYNTSCIQQCGTIIQPKHQAASIKNSSRSSKLKFVKNISDNTGTEKKGTGQHQRELPARIICVHLNFLSSFPLPTTNGI